MKTNCTRPSLKTERSNENAFFTNFNDSKPSHARLDHASETLVQKTFQLVTEMDVECFKLGELSKISKISKPKRKTRFFRFCNSKHGTNLHDSVHSDLEGLSIVKVYLEPNILL